MPALDLTLPYDTALVKGSTVIITGGASGLGEAMFRRYAELGANVVIGDVNTKLGEEVVADVRRQSGNDNHHFIHCDVTSWSSQAALFAHALSISPTGLINTVIANAGIPDPPTSTSLPCSPYDAMEEPDLSTLSVNLTGSIYTCCLAQHNFRRNLLTSTSPTPDMHLLLIGSMASFLDGAAVMGLYGASKHGLLGYYRTLRYAPGPQSPEGMRVNMVCPYFVDTPITPLVAKLVLAGIELAEKNDVVESVFKLQCNPAATGHVLVVAPPGAGGVQELDLKEMKTIEPFTNRVVGLMRREQKIQASIRWVKAMAGIFGVGAVTAVLVAILAATLWLAGVF